MLSPLESNRKDVTQVHEVDRTYHLQLIRTVLNSTLPSAINSSSAPCTPNIKLICSRCCCCLLLCDIHCMGTHLNSAWGPGLCRTSCAFSFNPFSPLAFFYIKSPLTHFSSDSVLIIRWSAKRSSQGASKRNTRCDASSTMIKSRGLRIEPWWTQPLHQALGCNI